MDFDEWIFKVCEHNALKYRKEPQDIYSLINLTDAKYAFIDGVSPEAYEISN